MDRKRRRHESPSSTSLIEIMERYDRAEAGPWPVEDAPEPILESSEPILTCVETPPPSGSVGASLKATRLRKGISLDEVYAATKIHPRVLVRLEADKYDSLPALQVARFVRNYAGFLGIDPPQLAAEHPELGKKSSEPPITSSPEQLPFVWPRVPVSRKLWTPASLGIAACVLVAPLIGFSGPGPTRPSRASPAPQPARASRSRPRRRARPSCRIGCWLATPPRRAPRTCRLRARTRSRPRRRPGPWGPCRSTSRVTGRPSTRVS